LAKPAGEYTVGMILRAIEGSLVPVACMEDEPNQCPRSAACVTLDIWKQINDAVSGVVDNITLADLVQKQQSKM
jgi:DNA-binding IscR family transcriptional regulator